MVSQNSLISIIVATFNRAHFISEALESISRQTYSNWECIIIDDGSTDSTETVLQPFLEKDSRFKYYKRTTNYKKGLPGSRNMGLDLAKGDTIIFFDDDDIVHPENLKINIEILSAYKAKFCRYDKKPFTGKFKGRNTVENGYTITQVGLDDLDKMIKGELPFASCTVMWSKDCFETLRFNEELHYAEEWELYSRILSMGFEGVSIDKVLYFNRKHPESNTGEFWQNSPKRRGAKVKAVKLVIDNLEERNLLSSSLTHYFIRLSFFLKESTLLDYILEKSGAGIKERVKFKSGFLFYPVIRPFFLLKAKFNKIK